MFFFYIFVIAMLTQIVAIDDLGNITFLGTLKWHKSFPTYSNSQPTHAIL
jgi:hypothetical protein